MQLDDRAAALDIAASPPVALVQLPFPSQASPLPELSAYYAAYDRKYRQHFPEYAVNSGDLWEAPLWIAHLDGALARDDTTFVDLSKAPFSAEACIRDIVEQVPPKALVFLSPLAQNLGLAAQVSRGLMPLGYRTIVGGNMSELAPREDFDTVHSGLLTPELYWDLVSGGAPRSAAPLKLGKQPKPLGYSPSYRLLADFSKRVPLVRLNASHGCLLACAFCGDAWSRQLHLVDRARLQEEVAELRRVFPHTRLVYLGDKTFGQSEAAVANLRHVIRPEYGFRLIVQTHVTVVTAKLIETMLALVVEVVELGFETASSTVLGELRKFGGAQRYREVIGALHASGLRVILNVLGGLPNETEESQARTLEFLDAASEHVWLYNLYNFVPYPKTPLFPTLKERIVDWDFQNWREDRPVVYEPYHQSRERSWAHFLRIVERATELLERTECPRPASRNQVGGRL